MRALASRAAQDRDAALAVEQRRQAIEILLADGVTTGGGGSKPGGLGRRRIGGGLQRDVAGHHHHRHAALADRLADRDLERARHLVGAGDQLAIMAALLEQRLRMRLLEIAAADLGRRDLRGDARAPARASGGNRRGR